MVEITIRPTLKFIRLAATLLVLAVIAFDVACYRAWGPQLRWWELAIPFLLLLWPGAHAVRRRYIRAVITVDRLRYEVGAASRLTRTIQLSKIQDVRVQQSVLQRIFGVGHISLETAGESSRLTIPDVDRPQAMADEITNRIPTPAGPAAQGM